MRGGEARRSVVDAGCRSTTIAHFLDMHPFKEDSDRHADTFHYAFVIYAYMLLTCAFHVNHYAAPM